jgi:DNA-binding NarL/FixJ family response regulator
VTSTGPHPFPAEAAVGNAAALSLVSAANAPGPRPFTVAVVDDQPMTRAGMEKVASEVPHLNVVSSVARVDQLHDGDGSVGYDIVVLALPVPADGSSLDAVARVARIGRVVLTSTWEQPPNLLAVVRAGARACLTRRCEQDAVVDALHVVALGGFYLCAPLVDRFHAELRRAPQDDPTGLAPREIETLRWIALGFTQSQIASRMGLSQATVNTYAKRIRNKLSAGNKAELTRMAIELGYLNNGHRHPAA